MSPEEFTAKYKDVDVTFDHYYKYTFYYRGVAPDGGRITCGVGGNSDDIYRHEVCNNEVRKVGDFIEDWSHVSLLQDGVQVFSWHYY